MLNITFENLKEVEFIFLEMFGDYETGIDRSS